MRNQSESKAEAIRRLPPLPPSYEWRIVCDQPQAWHAGCCYCHVYSRRTLQQVVDLVWAKWSKDSGLTRERYMHLLDFENRCINVEECTACDEREFNEIQTALEEALG